MSTMLVRSLPFVLGLLLVALTTVKSAAICAAGQPIVFTKVDTPLIGVDRSSVAWGDYDSDGDLDVLLSGRNDSVVPISRVYRNDGSEIFTDIAAGLQEVSAASGAWGDYDNDGDLDLLLAGSSGLEPATHLYRNDGGVFVDLAISMPDVYSASAAWGDYDNDGDLDVLLAGFTGSVATTRVYRNDGSGVFTDIAAVLPGVSSGSVAWGDYDNDGDLDILLAGQMNLGRIAGVYRNDASGVFTDVAAGLQAVSGSSATWGDYDNDGDLDILLTGRRGFDESVAYVYRNDGEAFIDIAAGIQGVYAGSVAWGDFDNDGDLDILLAGWIQSEATARVYRNDGLGVFTDIGVELPGVWVCSVAWGDYDNDGDLDILLTGDAGSENIARVYRNDGAPTNAPPTEPVGLSTSQVGYQLTLSWDAATDAQTPTAGLSYNLRIGTTPGGSEIRSAMAHAVVGYRRVVALGNAQQRTSWTVRVPSGARYYWSVQAIDGAFAGSPFAAEETVEPMGVSEQAAPVAFALHASAPNPLSLGTLIRYDMSVAERVRLVVFDSIGRVVRVLVDEEQVSGRHEVRWDGRNEAGRDMGSGVYYYRLEAGEFSETRALVKVR